jgi:ankyrin repeat protein
MRAIDNYDVEDIMDSLDRGADINMMESFWRNPLIKATMKRSMMMVRLLLEHDADPNVRGRCGETALHQASRWNVEAVRLLIADGAKVNVKSYLGYTPLHYACQNSEHDLEIIRILIDHGAETDIKTHLGNTPLALAKNDKIKRLLQSIVDAVEIKEPGIQ